MDKVSAITAYEQGELDEAETVELFQAMIDDGSVWHLQGGYGRAASDLVTRP